eukprot:TRINITY_DN15957_c0_g1_i1.p1 TRINITY_DN15957_c0_g1~~TRINITY_DN15957_c0_g1_i1.p1  ORF type:complete len:150 (+),score=8.77 TRINITY_DN15957_c0_g1_i1:1-450(+)
MLRYAQYTLLSNSLCFFYILIPSPRSSVFSLHSSCTILRLLLRLTSSFCSHFFFHFLPLSIFFFFSYCSPLPSTLLYPPRVLFFFFFFFFFAPCDETRRSVLINNGIALFPKGESKRVMSVSDIPDISTSSSENSQESKRSCTDMEEKK